MKSLILAMAMGFLACVSGIYAQDAAAFDQKSTSPAGLLDPSRFSIHNAVSFGMASSSFSSSLKSQGVYSTMLQYKFVPPVTLNLNFALPIYSSFNSAANLNAATMSSAQYFSNMPFEASLSWQPKENLFFRLSVVRQTQDYSQSLLRPFWNRDLLFDYR